MPSVAASKHLVESLVILAESDRSVQNAHFIRQSIITLRREASWINRRWCQNQRLLTKAPLWTH